MNLLEKRDENIKHLIDELNDLKERKRELVVLRFFRSFSIQPNELCDVVKNKNFKIKIEYNVTERQTIFKYNAEENDDMFELPFNQVIITFDKFITNIINDNFVFFEKVVDKSSESSTINNEIDTGSVTDTKHLVKYFQQRSKHFKLEDITEVLLYNNESSVSYIKDEYIFYLYSELINEINDNIKEVEDEIAIHNIDDNFIKDTYGIVANDYIVIDFMHGKETIVQFLSIDGDYESMLFRINGNNYVDRINLNTIKNISKINF